MKMWFTIFVVVMSISRHSSEAFCPSLELERQQRQQVVVFQQTPRSKLFLDRHDGHRHTGHRPNPGHRNHGLRQRLGQNRFPPRRTSPATTGSALFDLKSLEWKHPSDDKVDQWLESYGEQSRRTRRDVFTAADWIKSRRPERILYTVKTTFSSSLTRVIQKEMLVMGLISAFVVVYNNLFIKGWTWMGKAYSPLVFGVFGAAQQPIMLPALTLPLAPFTLCFGALGLLLAFRTNVSYQRWNDARTAWGAVINFSRSLARMGCIWGQSYKSSNVVSDSLIRKWAQAICAFSRSLMNRTLPRQEDEANFEKYCRETITEDPVFGQRLFNSKHRPTCALAEITSLLVQMRLNPMHQVVMEEKISGLCDALGAMERIFTSPVPTFYPRFTTRFLATWLMFLPLALYEVFNKTWNCLGMVPVVVVLSGFMLGIEELATEMDEPFSILPMEKMCIGAIQEPILEQLERSKQGVHPVNIRLRQHEDDYDNDDDSDDGIAISTVVTRRARYNIGRKQSGTKAGEFNI